MAALTACDKIPGLKDKDAQDKANAATAKVEQLEKEKSDLEERIGKLESQQFFTGLRLSDLENSEVDLKTDEDKYGIDHTSNGTFYVYVSKIEPFMDGYKVFLNVGNPSAATFSGANFNVRWGLTYDAKGKSLQEINESRKEKNISSTKSFSAGAYTLVELPLTPATAEEVRTISVSVKFDQLSLRRAM
jgi:hypothetical protein